MIGLIGCMTTVEVKIQHAICAVEASNRAPTWGTRTERYLPTSLLVHRVETRSDLLYDRRELYGDDIA